MVRRHLLPNVLPTVIVYGTLFVAHAILVEAAMSFLGLGVQPPTPPQRQRLMMWPPSPPKGGNPGRARLCQLDGAPSA